MHCFQRYLYWSVGLKGLNNGNENNIYMYMYEFVIFCVSLKTCPIWLTFHILDKMLDKMAFFLFAIKIYGFFLWSQAETLIALMSNHMFFVEKYQKKLSGYNSSLRLCSCKNKMQTFSHPILLPLAHSTSHKKKRLQLSYKGTYIGIRNCDITPTTIYIVSRWHAANLIIVFTEADKSIAFWLSWLRISLHL